MYVCVFMCMHVCVYVYMCVYMYTYVCVYIQDCLRKLEYCDKVLYFL